MPRKAAEEITMDEFDEIDTEIESGTLEYWRARARQWQKRCQRAESEKTDLIREIDQLKLDALGAKSPRVDRRQAIIRGESLGGTTGAPAAFGRA
jgi:hypothetical protein